MKYKLLLFPVLFFSINSIAQDLNYKWSVEANYSIINQEGIIREGNGIIDLGVKYRFLDLDFMKLGVGINGGFFSTKAEIGGDINFKTKIYYFQPRVFAEFNIPNINRLHPTVGIGYSSAYTRFSGTFMGIDTSEDNFTDSGLNLNFGMSYDISNKIFIQVQYDYIDNGYNDNTIKFGVGFRF